MCDPQTRAIDDTIMLQSIQATNMLCFSITELWPDYAINPEIVEQFDQRSIQLQHIEIQLYFYQIWQKTLTYKAFAK